MYLPKLHTARLGAFEPADQAAALPMMWQFAVEKYMLTSTLTGRRRTGPDCIRCLVHSAAQEQEQAGSSRPLHW